LAPSRAWRMTLQNFALLSIRFISFPPYVH
jgi:hypothetical protein